MINYTSKETYKNIFNSQLLTINVEGEGKIRVSQFELLRFIAQFLLFPTIYYYCKHYIFRLNT